LFLFLPLYAPDLNPIEIAFSKINVHLRRISGTNNPLRKVICSVGLRHRNGLGHGGQGSYESLKNILGQCCIMHVSTFRAVNRSFCAQVLKQFLLAETAQNLRKLAKIFPAPQKMN
jgi:hypothetical protein